MIKIGTRRNLLYPLIFSILNGIRKVDLIIMKKFFNFSGSTLLSLIMFFSDFMGGLIIYLDQMKYVKEKGATKYMGIELIQASSDMSPADSNAKMLILLIFLSYLDFAENILSSYYIPDKFKKVSKSLEWRLKSIIICFSGILSFFSLKIPIFKHQIISIIIILICLVITILTEMIEYYNEYNQEKGLRYIIYILFLLLINQAYTSGFDVIEKYFLEFNFINPFKLLMLEGIFGFVMTSLFCIHQDPLEQMKIINKKTPEKIKGLIIFLFVLFLLSCGRNIYRITTNKLYSPTTKALTDYIFVPLLIIYYFIFENDFTVKNKKIYYYFITNLIISFIIVICGLIYNEFIILFCCNLEYDTHYEVSKRAKKIQSKVFELSCNESYDDSIFSEED